LLPASGLADARAAAATTQDLLATGAVWPLRALVANAGLSATDTHASQSPLASSLCRDTITVTTPGG
jgi:hypothetical protein